MLSPKDIAIEDKNVLQEYLGKSESSTYNFTTLFMWAGSGKIQYDIVDGCLVLFFHGRHHGVGCTYPLGNGNRQAAAEKSFEFMNRQSGSPHFILMTEQMAEKMWRSF